MNDAILHDLRTIVAYVGIHRLAKELDVNPQTLAVVLLSPARAFPQSLDKVADAYRRTDLSQLRPPVVISTPPELQA